MRPVLFAAAGLLPRVVPSLERSVDEPTSGRTHGNVEVGENLVAWIIGLRWIAVFSATAVVGVATLATQRVAPEYVPSLWAGVLALAAFNGALTLVGPARLASQRALALQVTGDVAALAWLLHFAGGLQNPFSGFFVSHAAIAAVALEARLARRIAIAIGGFVLALAAVEATVLPPGCLLGTAQDSCSGSMDWMLHAAAGMTVTLVVWGCGFILPALVQALHAERRRLARTLSALAARTDDLAAARRRLQEEHDRLQMIIDCMADAVLFVSADGQVRLRNQAAQELWPPEALADDEGWRRLVESVPAPGTVDSQPAFEVRSRTYEASHARVCDPAGTFQGVVWVAHDVTERVETQRWRMEGERMAVVGKLAATLAHEINNPLGAIALFTQLALDEIDPQDPLADHLGTVLRNANLCKKIVRDVLEYARQRPPERRKVALERLLGDVVRTLEPRARTSRVAIHCDVDGHREAFVDGDPGQMRQILVNLGLNAIEAMPNGGVLTFRLTLTPGESVRIAVVDTGVGVPPDERGRIFAAFHTTKPDGTGLGLTVARDLAAAHGGTIEVESIPGQGSTFTVTIPSADRVPLARARP